MNPWEAIEKIENALSELELSDPRTGEKFEGILAAGIIGQFGGKEWDELLDNFETEKISAQEFHDHYMAIIKRFQLAEFDRKTIAAITQHVKFGASNAP